MPCVRIHRHIDGNIRDRLPGAEQAQNDNAAGQPERSAHQRNQHRLCEHLAQDHAAPRAERQAQRHFLGAIRGARRKQASQVRAGRQQNQPGQQHEPRHESTRRSAQHIAHQPGARQRELHAFVVSRIGLRQPCGQRIQVRRGLRRRHARLQPPHHKRRVIAALLQRCRSPRPWAARPSGSTWPAQRTARCRETPAAPRQ